MTIINFDDIIGKKFKTITNNVFCLNHPTNCLIIGKTNSGKTNVVMNLKAKNCIYEKIHIYTNNIDDKYNWLQNKFKNDVNFLENHVKIFNDKFDINRQDFYVNNVRNGDSIYIYGILDTNKEGMHYDLPSVRFKEPFLNIDNVRFENEIPNDISAFKSFKSKSTHQDDFLINYIEYLNYNRIYFWNISRQIKDDNANKFINIITGMETASCEVYIVSKTSASITLKYSKNDKSIVYKSQ